jgi:hypothetical protein
LMLVIEGMLPFLSPRRWRTLLMTMLAMDDQRIRTIGLLSMLMGVGLLYILNSI